MFKRTFVAVLLAVTFVGQLLAQDVRPALTKADQMSQSIDILWNIRAAVTKFEQGRRLNLYKVASIRITQCGLIYGILRTIPSYDADTKAAFNGVVEAYTRAGAHLFPEPLPAYQAMVTEAATTLEKLKQDKPRMMTFLKSCMALAATEDEALRAVTELSISGP